jgi:hypothetical protein
MPTKTPRLFSPEQRDQFSRIATDLPERELARHYTFSGAYDWTTVGVPSGEAAACILGTRYTAVLSGIVPPGLRRATRP